MRPAKQPTAGVALCQKKRLDTHTLYLKHPPPLPMDVLLVSWPWPPIFFLQSLVCVATMQQPFILSIMATSCPTSSSHLSLTFLTPRLPPKIRIGILLSNNLTTCPAKMNLLTLYLKTSWGCCVQKNHAWDHFDCFMKNVRFDVLKSNWSTAFKNHEKWSSKNLCPYWRITAATVNYSIVTYYWTKV
jgi:hypothetical protein